MDTLCEKELTKQMRFVRELGCQFESLREEVSKRVSLKGALRELVFLWVSKNESELRRRESQAHSARE